MWKFWTNLLMPKGLKSCPKSNKSPNMVTLDLTERISNVKSLGLPIGRNDISLKRCHICRYFHLSPVWPVVNGENIFCCCCRSKHFSQKFFLSLHIISEKIFFRQTMAFIDKNLSSAKVSLKSIEWNSIKTAHTLNVSRKNYICY